MEAQPNRWKNEKKHSVPRDVRAQILSGILIMFAGVIVVKLFFLQVIDHGFYSDLASGQHDLFQELFPERGDILIHDDKDNNLIAAVTNQKLAFVFADPRQIKDVAKTVEELSKIFSWDEETKTSFTAKFAINTDPYEPIKRHVSDDDLALIEALKLPGIDYIRESSRLYPEAGLGGHLFGFLGSNSDGTLSGKYGVEGFFDDALTGMPGFLRSEGDIAGRLIASADRAFQPAIDGADVVLTIDRNIQYFVCDQLKKTVLEYNADGGSVVVVEPKTGRVLAMCGLPDFDPNNYSKVNDLAVYNNTAIFTATGASVGIGFAIPSNIAKKVVQQIRQYGRTKRGWIGVHIQAITEDIAESLGLKDLKGALVGNVVKDGPAAKAKLQTGDIILKVGNQEVKDIRSVPRLVGNLSVGTDATLTIWRRGKILTVPVRIGEYEEASLIGGTSSVGFPNTGVPRFPNTGLAPKTNNSLWYPLAGLIFGVSAILISIQRKS